MSESKGNTENVGTDKVSEFDKIFDRIQNQLDLLDEYSSKITNKVVQIKDFREPLDKEGEDRSGQDCLLGKLESQIERFSYLNDRLCEVKNALNDYV